MKFNTPIGDLQKKAIMWWPDDLKKEAAGISSIPLLLDSQESFISILRLCKDSPEQIQSPSQKMNLMCSWIL